MISRMHCFYAGDMKDILTQDFINQHGRPDVIITDPPRAGMHQDVVDVILFAEPKRIVYVSCNPATQARICNYSMKIQGESHSTGRYVPSHPPRRKCGVAGTSIIRDDNRISKEKRNGKKT